MLGVKRTSLASCCGWGGGGGGGSRKGKLHGGSKRHGTVHDCAMDVVADVCVHTRACRLFLKLCERESCECRHESKIRSVCLVGRLQKTRHDSPTSPTKVKTAQQAAPSLVAILGGRSGRCWPSNKGVNVSRDNENEDLARSLRISHGSR